MTENFVVNSSWQDRWTRVKVLINYQTPSDDPISCYGNSFTMQNFIGPLHWFPIATDCIVCRLSSRVDRGLYVIPRSGHNACGNILDLLSTSFCEQGILSSASAVSDSVVQTATSVKIYESGIWKKRRASFCPVGFALPSDICCRSRNTIRASCSFRFRLARSTFQSMKVKYFVCWIILHITTK